MTSLRKQLQVLTPTTTAILPVVPLQEPHPAVSEDPATLQVLEELATLHFAAFVALYGPPPPDVAVQCVHASTAKGPQPGYFGKVQGLASPAALQWLAALSAGLDRWDEAGFDQPLRVQTFSDGKALVSIQPYHDAIRQAHARLRAAGKHARADRLKEHLQSRLIVDLDSGLPEAA